MKLYRYIICITATLLVGCSNSLVGNGDDDLVDVHFTMNTMDDTRAGEDEPTPSRYVVEIYGGSGVDYKFIEQKEYADPNFTLRLPKGNYNFYFWADSGPNYYDTKTLSAVTVKPNDLSLERVCYAGKKIGVVIGESFPPIDVTIKRPVARINYINTGAGAAPGTEATFVYTAPGGYNVVAETPLASISYSISSTYDATSAFFAVDYLFPVESGKVDIVATIASKVTTMTNITIQANKQTNISAKFNN